MSRYWALAACLLAPGLAQGQTVAQGDAWITGKAGVGTTAPAARLEVKPSSMTETIFQVSGVDETPFLVVGKNGKVGLSTTPAANLDVSGAGDLGDIGLQVRNGNLYPSTSSVQLAFGYAGQAAYRHAIRTRHSSTTANNSIDFLLWTPAAGAASALPSLEALSLVSTAAGASFHVLPAGTPDVEVEVSSLTSVGGGTVLRSAEAAHCSRALKKDIRYLQPEDRARALEELRGLRLARFRYKRPAPGGPARDPGAPLRRGLIYEESPADLQGPGRSVIADERLSNAELALQELIRRLEALQQQAEAGHE